MLVHVTQSLCVQGHDGANQFRPRVFCKHLWYLRHILIHVLLIRDQDLIIRCIVKLHVLVHHKCRIVRRVVIVHLALNLRIRVHLVLQQTLQQQRRLIPITLLLVLLVSMTLSAICRHPTGYKLPLIYAHFIFY